MLLKTRNNLIGVVTTPTAVVNIDGLRTDGTTATPVGSGGTFPDGAVLPGSVVVSNGGDTQTFTDNSATVSARNFGLDAWGDWV